MKFSLFICLGILVGCSEAKLASENSKLSAASKTYYLGMGYDKLLDKFQASCVTGNIHTENQTLSHWKFSRVESWTDEKLNLGFSSSFSYQTGIINADAKAQFTRDLHDSELSSTYLLDAEFISQTSFLIDSKLKDSVSALMADRGYNAFREKCGNSFVSVSDKGGRFLAYIKFKFSDRELKNEFNFNASYKGGIVNVDASVDSLSLKQKKSSYAEINIFMEGGDLATFNEVLSDNFPIECKLDNWEKCKRMVESIIRYSSSTFPADIAKGHVRNISKTVSSYDLDSTKVDPKFSERRNILAKETEKQAILLSKIEDILKLEASKLAESRAEDLRIESLKLSNNLEILYEAIYECQQANLEDLSCPQLVDLNLREIDTELIHKKNLLIKSMTLGFDGGSPYRLECPNFITGFFGRRNSLLDKLGLHCDDGRATRTVGRHNTHSYNRSCPAGYILTGFRAKAHQTRYHQGIGGMALICSNYNDMLMSSSKPRGKRIHIFGDMRSDGVEWKCPQGTAASSVSGRSGDIVDKFALTCKSF